MTSYIPIKAGTKQPAVSWKGYQEKPAPDSEVAGWLEQGHSLAVVTGAVSGNLEVIDFDHEAETIATKFLARVAKLWPEDEKPFVVATQKGYHLYYRTQETTAGNQKLALDEEGNVLIETRGEGGYVLTPNKNDDRYEVVYGSIKSLPVLDKERHTLLMETARGFNRKWREVRGSEDEAGEGRPGDDYNSKVVWSDLLEPDGWSLLRTRGDGTSEWVRPGKKDGISATTGYGESDLLFVFSTSVSPLEGGTAYSKFAYYATMRHGGDFRAAARDLVGQGYGDPVRGGADVPSVMATLLAIADEQDLFLGTDGIPYAKIGVYSYPVEGEFYLFQLEREYTERTGKVPSEKQLSEAARKISRAARIREDVVRQVFIRVGYANGSVYVDLGQEVFYRIHPRGYEQVAEPGCYFTRSRGTMPTPEETTEDVWKQMSRLFNVSSAEEYILLVHWLIACFNPNGTYPILLIQGDEGAAKSYATKMVKRIIDPTPAEATSYPKSPQQVFINAHNNFVQSYDNLSGMSNDVSDAFCTVASGATFATRTLYTTMGQTEIKVKRPIVMNGIDSLTRRADLSSRSLSLDFKKIEKEDRMTELEVDKALEQIHGAIIGALFTAVAAALDGATSQRATVQFKTRLTDFHLWGLAATRSLPWSGDDFEAALDYNNQRVTLGLLSNDSISGAISNFMSDKGAWEGTAAELFEAIERVVPIKTTRAKDWPQTAGAFGRAVHRARSILNGIGITFESTRDRRGTHYIFKNHNE